MGVNKQVKLRGTLSMLEAAKVERAARLLDLRPLVDSDELGGE